MGSVLAADRQNEDAFRAGYQEAVGEAVRFLVEVKGYDPGDGHCMALTSHLQRHVEGVIKGKLRPVMVSSSLVVCHKNPSIVFVYSVIRLLLMVSNNVARMESA